MQDLNSFTDSDDDFAVKMRKLIKNLEDMMSGEKKFTLILEDPLSNSFLQNPYHP
jgi:C4-type Zn-finger protein